MGETTRGTVSTVDAVVIPDRLRANAQQSLGRVAGGAWVDSLPATIRELSSAWHLHPRATMAASNRSLVIDVVAPGGVRAVLKLLPDRRDCQAQAEALDRWSHIGAAPRVLAVDRDHGGLLVEWASGPSLLERPGRAPEATRQVVAALASTHRPPPATPVRHAFEHTVALAEHALTRAAASSDPNALFPVALLQNDLRSAGLLDERPSGLLHGDLVPGNVLYDQDRDTIALIDPEPQCGPLERDVAVWCLRAQRGEQADALVRVAVKHAELDERLLRWLVAFNARAYARQRAHTGRDVPPAVLEVARHPTLLPAT